MQLDIETLDLYGTWLEMLKEWDWIEFDENDPDKEYFREFLNVSEEIYSRVCNGSNLIDQADSTKQEFRIHGDTECPRPCSDCSEGKHHWLEQFAGNEPGHEAAVKFHLVAWYGCKHCNSWTPNILEED